MDDLLDALRVLQLDNSQSVRDELYSTAGEWLLKLPDRWSIGYKVLPFLLSGMTDGIPKSVRLCEEYMDKVGKLYEEEWNERVKDELDYMQTEDTVATTGRPRIGSRHFARESTQKIVTLCIEGMADWNAEVRVKSAQILATFMHYSEDKVTGYTGVILPALYKVLAGDEARVMAEALNVAVSLGKYVQPDVYLEVIDPALRNGQGGSTQHRMGCLRSLEGLLRGTPPARLDAVRLERLIHALHDKELMNNENVELLAEVSSVVAEIVKLVPSTAGTVPTGNVSPTAGNAAFGVFVIITHLFSIEADDKVVGNQQTRAKCTQALQVLATAHGLFSVQDLFGVYLTAMLDRLIFTEASWTRYSPELRVLRTVLLESGPAVGQHLDVIIPLLSRIAAPDKDMEVRETVLDILRSHLQSRPSPLNSQSRLPAHSIPILRKIIITNAVWRPGRKLAALRTKSIDALLALLSNTEVGEGHIGLLTTGALQSSWDPDLCNVLVSTLEDDSMATRQSTLSVLDLLLQGLVFDANTFRKVYQELQKRLDDAHDELRIHVAKVWATYFTALGRWNLRMAPFVAASGTANSVLVDERGQLVQEGGGLLEIALDEVHAVAMVKGLAIHMDDTNATLQEAVFGALQVATRVLPPTVMREQLSAVRGKHRSPRYIDALLAEIPA
ncbi:HEAT repeat-containing protein 2 [Thoreauomyces humboldtii]|nr:HEAT repeat-containing protein 2 [Thoreauomyces humboldtii]